MAELDAEVTAHRTLDIGISKLPYNLVELPESYARPFRKAGARTAYTFRDNKLLPIMYLAKKDTSFADYATAWEKLHSSLIHGDGAGSAYPLVSENGIVIGHYGEFDFRDFYVPNEGGNLDAMVDQGTVYIDKQPGHKRSGEMTETEAIANMAWKGRNIQHRAEGHKEYRGTAQSRITVLTDVNGYVTQIVGRRSTDGITPVYYSPADLIAIPRLIYLVGKTAARKFILTIARRRLAKKAAAGAGQELKSIAAPKPPIHGSPPQVRVGRMGEPGDLNAYVHVTREGEVIYQVSTIVLKGEGNAAAIALARASHREMIRRAALHAQQLGKKTFKLLGKQANSNFRRHADDLAKTMGIPAAKTALRDGGGAYADYEVTLIVEKVLK